MNAGVRVEGSSVEDGGECFLMLDEIFEVAHRYLKMVKEMRALLENEGLVAGRWPCEKTPCVTEREGWRQRGMSRNAQCIQLCPCLDCGR